ncbi:MAG: hypothetical protein R3B84_13630 [Zavarzinella sp.]
MRLHHPQQREAFSLIEVIVATAIFLLSLVAISSLVDFGTDRAVEVRAQSLGTRLCQSKLNEFAAGVELLENAASGGSFEEEPNWSWEAEVVQEGAPNLYRVTIIVTGVSPEIPTGQMEVQMTRFIYDPAMKGRLSGNSTTDESTTSGSTSGS